MLCTFIIWESPRKEESEINFSCRKVCEWSDCPASNLDAFMPRLLPLFDSNSILLYMFIKVHRRFTNDSIFLFRNMSGILNFIFACWKFLSFNTFTFMLLPTAYETWIFHDIMWHLANKTSSEAFSLHCAWCSNNSLFSLLHRAHEKVVFIKEYFSVVKCKMNNKVSRVPLITAQWGWR